MCDAEETGGGDLNMAWLIICRGPREKSHQPSQFSWTSYYYIQRCTVIFILSFSNYNIDLVIF